MELVLIEKFELSVWVLIAIRFKSKRYFIRACDLRGFILFIAALVMLGVKWAEMHSLGVVCK